VTCPTSVHEPFVWIHYRVRFELRVEQGLRFEDITGVKSHVYFSIMTSYGHVNRYRRSEERTASVFYSKNGGCIAFLDAGTHHNLEIISQHESFLFTELFGGKVDHFSKNVC
jgi:hypothetical protein